MSARANGVWLFFLRMTDYIEVVVSCECSDSVIHQTLLRAHGCFVFVISSLGVSCTISFAVSVKLKLSILGIDLIIPKIKNITNNNALNLFMNYLTSLSVIICDTM